MVIQLDGGQGLGRVPRAAPRKRQCKSGSRKVVGRERASVVFCGAQRVHGRRRRSGGEEGRQRQAAPRARQQTQQQCSAQCEVLWKLERVGSSPPGRGGSCARSHPGWR